MIWTQSHCCTSSTVKPKHLLGFCSMPNLQYKVFSDVNNYRRLTNDLSTAKMKPTTDRLNLTIIRRTSNRPILLTKDGLKPTNSWWQTSHESFQPIPSWLNWPIAFNGPDLKHHGLTKHYSLDSEDDDFRSVVETSVTNKSPFQRYPHPDYHTIPSAQALCRPVIWRFFSQLLPLV